MRIPIIILVLFFISCSPENKNKHTEPFAFLKPNFKSEVTIDFSKHVTDCILDLEEQLQQDLCVSNTHLTGIILNNKEAISFPLVVYKNCGFLVHFKNKLPVMINAKNEVLIDSNILLDASDSIKKDLLKVTENLLENENYKTIVYLFQWDTALHPLKTRDRLLEIFYVTKEIMNTLSIKKYGKDVTALNEHEWNVLKKEYNPMIGIEDTPIPTIMVNPD